MVRMFSLRVSIHSMGRPRRRAAAATTISSGRAPALAPNPPPMSGTITRTSPSSRRSEAAISPRRANGCWDVAQTVSRPASGETTMASGSRGTGARRWFTKRPLTVTSAPRSGSSSVPEAKWPATLEACLGKRCTWEPWRAAAGSVTTSSGSRSTWTSAAASPAASLDSAMTIASGSPTKRTRSSARRGRANGAGTISNPTRAGRSRSAPVRTATTPGSAAAALVSIALTWAWASGERTKTACRVPTGRRSPT